MKVHTSGSCGFAAAVAAMEREGFDPHIATERQRHHSASSPAAGSDPTAEPATAKEKMQAKLKTPAGRAVYARRKVIVEPVFGQTKSCRGIDRLMQRGLANCQAEWKVICGTHNLLKLWRSGKGRRNARA